MVNIDTLITEGQEIRNNLIYINPPSRGWRSYDEYALKNSDDYFSWASICFRFLTKLYPKDNVAQQFQSSAEAFEKESNHYSPHHLEKMIGILRSCKAIPSCDSHLQMNDLVLDDEISNVERADSIYQSFDYSNSNSVEAIKAYHIWYSASAVLFSRFFHSDDVEYKRFRNINNSCNGFGLHDNYFTLQSSFNILLRKIKSGVAKELTNAQTNVTSTNEGTKHPLLFISHSSEEVAFVESLVSLLQKLGFNKTNLFCSSIEGYGIDEGEDIYETLRAKFTETKIYVVFVLSENYYKSPACLNEMGATWVIQSEYTTIVMPGFDIPDIKGAINPRKMAIVLNDDRHIRSMLNSFRTRLMDLFNLQDLDDDIVWENNRNSFINSVRELYPDKQ